MLKEVFEYNSLVIYDYCKDTIIPLHVFFNKKLNFWVSAKSISPKFAS